MASVVRLVTDTAARLIFTPATVGTVTEHDRFRTIELVGEKLVGTDFVPGDKLRIHLGGTTLRTYTPMSWDADRGATELLTYLPGAGPGSEWSENASTGTPAAFLGPQRSVRLDRIESPPIFVGDETSFGLLLAWGRLHPDVSPVASLFEVTDPGPAAAVLPFYGTEVTELVSRTTDASHLAALEDRVVAAVRAAPDAPLCLTGKAQTIASIRRRLKAEGLTRKGTEVKAYWDQNRKGLD
jgi:NADPH-dependent ferric siderophore reductase